MTKSFTNKFTQWKRPLIGGFLSALVAGIFLMTFGFLPIWENLRILIHFGFLAPVLLLAFIFIIPVDAPLWSVLIPAIFWFMVGAIITYYKQENRKAIIYWFVFYIFSFVLGYVIGSMFFNSLIIDL
jgi:hypothetical protein